MTEPQLQALRDISEFGPSLELILARRILAYRLLGAAGRMIDVGANVGSSFAPFLHAGWSVLAFEPDPRNVSAIRERFKDEDGLILIDKAVSDRVGEELTLYVGADSAMSTLNAYDASHEAFCTVTTTTLADALPKHGWNAVDLLKCDAEGFDLHVLRGHDFETCPPRIVVAEFDNKKTRPLGYTTQDLSAFLEGKGYHLLFSERFPLIDYDPAAPRRRRRFDAGTDVDPESWGDVVAIQDSTDFEIAQVLAPALLDMQRRIWQLEAERAIDSQGTVSDRPSPRIVF